MLPRAAQQHYAAQQKITLATIAGLRRLWSRVSPQAISESWEPLGRQALALLGAGQLAEARESVGYVSQVLVELDIPNDPVARINPASLVGWSSSGMPLSGLLDYPAVAAKEGIAQGLSPVAALRAGRNSLDGIAQLQLADAGRAAESLEIATRPVVTSYTRMLRLPSCARCAILAGRVYPWSAGFARHPRCDCVHIPTTEDVAQDIRTDPLGAIRAGQVRGLSKAELAAIIDEGADLNQVVNAHRGMRTASGQLRTITVNGHRLRTTIEGTTARGFASSRLGKSPRLTVETIYKIADGNRAVAQKMLYRNGYLLDPPASKSIATGPRAPKAQTPPPTRPQSPPPVAPDGPRKPPPPVPPVLMASGPDRVPPERIPRYGMLGPDTSDEFGMIGDYSPPCKRSDIEVFDEAPAWAVLYGDGTGHGHHAGTETRGGKSRFPEDWEEAEVVRFVNGIIDRPMYARPARNGFNLYGLALGQEGVVYVRYEQRWIITSTHPRDMAQWPYD